MKFEKQNKQGKVKIKRERLVKTQSLNYREQTRREGAWGMGSVGDGIKFCTCRVSYGGVESLYCAPEINIMLYVDCIEIKNKN